MPRTSCRSWFFFALFWMTVAACRPEGEQTTILETFETPTPALDADGDGYRAGEGDCDDADPNRHPGEAEGTPSTTVPGALDGDGVDNDCDGLVDEGTLDFDDDHDGYSERNNDCDDDDGSVHPGNVDGCDGVDNDCDGQIDEDARDGYEPNDTLETARDLGDLTCSYEVVEINLDHGGDADFFRFQVCDSDDNASCNASCPFVVAIQLQDIPEGLEFQVTVYRDRSGVPVEIADFQTQGSDGEAGILLEGSPGIDDGGTYYAGVTSGPDNSGVSCHDAFRLVVFGEKPVHIPLPGEDVSPTPSG